MYPEFYCILDSINAKTARIGTNMEELKAEADKSPGSIVCRAVPIYESKA